VHKKITPTCLCKQIIAKYFYQKAPRQLKNTIQEYNTIKDTIIDIDGPENQ
jgi:hypothetical protein